MWLSLVVLALDGTIVNVAIPPTAITLRGSESQLQYTLALATLLRAAGHVADRLGRQWLFLEGLGPFCPRGRTTTQGFAPSPTPVEKLS